MHPARPPRRRWLWRALLGLALLLLLLVTLAVLCFERLVLLAMTPRGPFDPAAVPPAPDYADPSAWSALPGRDDAADVAPPGVPTIDPSAAPVDVFYVHPTTHIGPTWNGRIDDAALADTTDRVATRIQASAFNGCCAVYAPRYRQASGLVYSHPSDDGERAADLAYADIDAAFTEFLARRGRARPFILAGHSQGAWLAWRLLRDRISGSALSDSLVAAYLPGAALPKQPAPGVPACAAPEQLGCVASWNARAPGYARGAFEFREPPEGRLCVNPITWREDQADAPASASAGAVFLDAEVPALLPGFAGARCQDGTLVVTELGEVPRDFMSRLLDRALGPGNYHPIEYQIYWADLRRNADARVAAWLRAHPPVSTTPASR